MLGRLVYKQICMRCSAVHGKAVVHLPLRARSLAPAVPPDARVFVADPATRVAPQVNQAGVERTLGTIIGGSLALVAYTIGSTYWNNVGGRQGVPALQPCCPPAGLQPRSGGVCG